MRLRFFFLLSFFILSLLAIVGCGSSSTGTSSTTSGYHTLTINNMQITLNYTPQPLSGHMKLNESYILTATMAPNIKGTPLSKLQGTTGGLSVGTPAANLDQSFPGYTPYAEACLDVNTDTFSYDPTLQCPPDQTLEQNDVIWSWNISPKQSGSQVIGINIQVIWKSNSGSKVAGYFLPNQVLDVVVESDLTPTAIPSPVTTPTPPSTIWNNGLFDTVFGGLLVLFLAFVIRVTWKRLKNWKRLKEWIRPTKQVPTSIPTPTKADEVEEEKEGGTNQV